MVSKRWPFTCLGLSGWIVFAFLVAAAAVTRFRLTPVALSEWDSWGWLHPALSWLGGTGFREEFEREWLYGAFLAACLRATGSFSGFVLVQQVLGLLAGLFMWLTWRTWMALFPRDLLCEALSVVVGLLVAAAYFFSPTVLTLELSIRPEGIMACLAFLQLLCITAYCRFRWRKPRHAAALVSGALAILLAFALFVLKPNWLLAAAGTTLPVVAGLFGGSFPLLIRILTPILGVLLVILTLILPEKAFFIHTAETRVVLPMTLFTIHANVIYDNMLRELSSPGTPDERRRFLEGFLPIFDREMETAKGLAKFYPRLGFDPDYLMYRSSIFPYLEGTCAMSRQEIAAFCRESFLSATLNRPWAYGRKVATQLAYFVFPDQGTFFRPRIKLGTLYEYALETLPANLDQAISEPVKHLYQDYRRGVSEQAGRDVNLDTLRPLRPVLTVVKASAIWIEMAFLISWVSCLLFRSLVPCRLPGFLALVFFLAPGGNAITVALVHALDNSRYRGSYGPLLLFALAALAFFCVVTVTRMMRSRRRQSPALLPHAH